MKKKLKCFISSNADADLRAIRKVLSDLNVEVDNLYDFSIGLTLTDLMKRKIREADFIIGIFPNDSRNVLFELGIAEALGKPIFLLLEQTNEIPFYLQNKIFFQVDWLKNTDFLKLSLKNYILDISKKPSSYKRNKNIDSPLHLSIDYTNNQLINLKKLRETSFKEVDLINIVMDVLEKINVQAVSELLVHDRSRVDIAIKHKGISGYLGNPVLIEIKSGNLNNNTIMNAQSQLQQYIEKTKANFGLLLYFDKNNKHFGLDFHRFTNILIFDVEEFIQGIASEGFEEFLLRKRNEFVHSSR